jgi:hypothetical protein
LPTATPGRTYRKATAWHIQRAVVGNIRGALPSMLRMVIAAYRNPELNCWLRLKPTRLHISAAEPNSKLIIRTARRPPAMSRECLALVADTSLSALGWRGNCSG